MFHWVRRALGLLKSKIGEKLIKSNFGVLFAIRPHHITHITTINGKLKRNFDDIRVDGAARFFRYFLLLLFHAAVLHARDIPAAAREQ